MNISIKPGDGYRIYAGRKLPDITLINNPDDSFGMYSAYFLGQEINDTKLYLIRIYDDKASEKFAAIFSESFKGSTSDKIVYINLANNFIQTNCTIELSEYLLSTDQTKWTHLGKKIVETSFGDRLIHPFWSSFNFMKQVGGVLDFNTFYLEAGRSYPLAGLEVIEWEGAVGAQTSVNQKICQVSDTIYDLQFYSPRYYCTSTKDGFSTETATLGAVKENVDRTGWYIKNVCYMPYEKNVVLDEIQFAKPGFYLVNTALEAGADPNELNYVFLFSFEEQPWEAVSDSSQSLQTLIGKITAIADTLRNNIGISKELTLDEMKDLISNFRVKPANVFPYPSFEYNTNDIFSIFERGGSIQATVVKDGAGIAKKGKYYAQVICAQPDELQGDEFGIAYIPFDFIQPGHHYYFQGSVNAKWDEQNYPVLYFGRNKLGNTAVDLEELIQIRLIDSSGLPLAQETWHTVSNIYAAPQKDSPEDPSVYNLILGCSVGLSLASNRTWMDEILVVDLTESFGQGREPNLNACKKLFEGYNSDSVFCELPSNFQEIIDEAREGEEGEIQGTTPEGDTDIEI